MKARFVNEALESHDPIERWHKFIDSLPWMQQHTKEELKSDDDLLREISRFSFVMEGIKDLTMLFDERNVDFYNNLIKTLGQDSYVKTFYRNVEEFVEVVKRLNGFVVHPERDFIMTNVLGYCNPVALRYMSEDCMKHILSNKHLVRKSYKGQNKNFQSMWAMPLNLTDFNTGETLSCGTEGCKPWYSVYSQKPFIPTSDEEHEEAILEIILDSHS